MFPDTVSLVYEIKTEDAYEDFYKDKNLFDFSDYSLNSKFFDPVNKKVIGKMKDEFKGKIIGEFVGLNLNYLNSFNFMSYRFFIKQNINKFFMLCF